MRKKASEALSAAAERRADVTFAIKGKLYGFFCVLQTTGSMIVLAAVASLGYKLTYHDSLTVKRNNLQFPKKRHNDFCSSGEGSQPRLQFPCCYRPLRYGFETPIAGEGDEDEEEEEKKEGKKMRGRNRGWNGGLGHCGGGLCASSSFQSVLDGVLAL